MNCSSVMLGALFACYTTLSAQVTFSSGPTQVTLVELYTSEGCSSCPPAEKWLGALREHPGLWRDFVPVAFHVNYWDHLGWRDTLASKVFTDREHAYARAWRADSVYTPCFARNGAEWRPRDGELATRAERSAPGSSAGVLKVSWRPDNTCQVEYTRGDMNSRHEPLQVSVALLGGGIVSNVRAGENRGRELRHEFVALRFESAPLTANDVGMLSASLTLPPRTDLAANRRALAAWITARGKLTPLQATGGWLP